MNEQTQNHQTPWWASGWAIATLFFFGFAQRRFFRRNGYGAHTLQELGFCLNDAFRHMWLWFMATVGPIVLGFVVAFPFRMWYDKNVDSAAVPVWDPTATGPGPFFKAMHDRFMASWAVSPAHVLFFLSLILVAYGIAIPLLIAANRRYRANWEAEMAQQYQDDQA